MSKKKLTSAYDRLLQQGFSPEIPLGAHSSIACKEKGVSYSIEKLRDVQSARFAIDGGIITEGSHGESKCDKLILLYPVSSDHPGIQLFVELKASDVEKGLKQIEETLKHPTFAQLARCESREARLVARKFPAHANRPSIERMKETLIRKYACRCKIIRANAPETLDSFLT